MLEHPPALMLQGAISMIFIDNKYTRWYYNIINNAKSKLTLEYTEKHHIIPQSLGGDNSNNNLVILTAKEHFVCHLLLTKMVTGSNKIKMFNAAFQMTISSLNQTRHRINGRTYSVLKKAKSDSMKGNTYGSHPMSEETKQKISKAKIGKPNHKIKGVPKSTETRKKLSDARKGATPWNIGLAWTDATRQKISAARQNTKKIKCVHCSKEISPSNWTRWHNDNCKEKAPVPHSRVANPFV